MDERAEAVAAWESLSRAQMAVFRRLRSSLPDELSMIEYEVLDQLAGSPHQRTRISEFNRCLLLAPSSISRLIDRLAERGLVTKRVDPSDARCTVVELAKPGAALFDRMHATHSDNVAKRMLAALDPEELRLLGELSDKLREATEGERGATRPLRRLTRPGDSTAA